jgi:hypothetical protein
VIQSLGAAVRSLRAAAASHGATLIRSAVARQLVGMWVCARKRGEPRRFAMGLVS